MRRRLFVLLALVALPADAAAQALDLGALLPEGGGTATGRIIQLVALLTVLSLAPGLLIMVTSFTRFIVALSFLRSGLGVPSTPANLILISLALFMTFYVMGPTFSRAWETGVTPLMQNEISEEEALGRIVEPFREFMLNHVREKDLAMLEELREAEVPARDEAPAPEAVPGAAPEATPESAPESVPGAVSGAGAVGDAMVGLSVLIPAFMISELRRGFEIGFLIILPFLVIDLIVATLVMSMGMMMLPPTVISLPFKILFFILIDGWNVLVGGLVRSFF